MFFAIKGTRDRQLSRLMNKWPDFLFTVIVRFLCGTVLGAVICLVFFYKGILTAFSHNHIRVVVVWLILWVVGGGLVAVFSVPRWQTPWYKGIRDRDSKAKQTFPPDF